MRAAEASGADGLLVTHPADVRYLSGFTGSNGAVVMAGGRAVFLTDGRYTTQAKAEVQGLRVVVQPGPLTATGVKWMLEHGVRRCAFDAAQTTVAGLEAWRAAAPAGVRRGLFVATSGLVARLREVKDAEEIARMRRAAARGCALFNGTLAELPESGTEIGFALALEGKARAGGAEAMSFETIVASGPRSALPHGKASGKKLPRRGFVTVDFGIVLDGYCSDMTRTVHLGKANGRSREVYDAVLEAQRAAVDAVRAGVTCGEVDEAARSVLRRRKLDRFFTHSTGHGVGLEIHENPRVASKGKQVLEAGMVITIEPGAYLPDEFGIRIEDMVLVTGRGGEVLTGASAKDLIEL